MSNTPLLETLEVCTGPEPKLAVIWLHGLGADGRDFEPIVPELVDPQWPAIRFVFPHAPVRPVTVNGGMRMRAWYDILGMDIASRQDAPGIRDSIVLVEALIAREAARGIPTSHTFIAGFSQGAAITLALGLRHKESLAGLIALSGYLPLAASLAEEASAANRATPVFMAHGQYDPVVAEALGTASREQLLGMGYSVQWHSYPMQHSVCAQEIADLRSWLSQHIPQ